MKIFNAKSQRTQSAPENFQSDFSLRNSASSRFASRAPRPKNFQPSTFNLQPSQRGIALIITLILLAVVTVMAVAFLANSRRERGSVTTTTDTAGARLAADAALAAAESQIMANTLATTNSYNFGLVVSTNYINSFGFDPGAGANPTNVSYNYDIANGGGPVAGNDALQNIANLLYSPRAPVFVPSPAGNYSSPTNYDFRFYLDLNRNGRFETNYFGQDFDNNGNVIPGNPYLHVGDPEWIGVLDHPDQPHGPNNHFIARYAFVAVPIGNALDLNAIYNQAASKDVNPGSGGSDGFMRNQGVGSWEINLAAFLADLNTNEWLPTIPPDNLYYAYNEPVNAANSGRAFEDALSLLSYRYGYSYGSLFSADNLFATAQAVFPYDNIDEYSDGPLQTNLANINEFANRDKPIQSWSGADNTNHFFDMQELFDTNETERYVSPPGFTDRLLDAGNVTPTHQSTYDRYTFYRLLSQMGVGSAPEQDRMNLNYSNAAAYFYPDGTLSNITYYPDAETNLVPWMPLQFFTIAADRMLRAYSQDWLARDPADYVASYDMTTNIGTVPFPTNVPVSFGITDIPVLVSNQFVYSSAINRVLQLAANIYDATTNNTFVMGRDYPSVFRPTFNVVLENGYTNVYVNGYEQVFSVSGTSDPQLNVPYDVNTLASSLGFGTFTNVNVYGVPWIIGAKKGFPNFNEFAMENAFQLTRKLQVTRPGADARYPSQYQFNQMFDLSVSNQLGVECWNSYTNNFNDSVDIYVTDDPTVTLTNDEGFSFTTNLIVSGFPFPLTINNTSYNNNGWPGYNPTINSLLASDSFQIPLNTNMAGIPDSMYRFNDPNYPFPHNNLSTNLALPYETGININGQKYPQPHWWLMITNNLRVIVLDTTSISNRIIDYVQLRGPNTSRDLTAEIITEWDKNPYTNAYDGLWDTNVDGQNVPNGVDNQLGISLGLYGLGSAPNGWNQVDSVEASNEINGFRAFCNYQTFSGYTNDIGLDSTTNNLQAPFTPTATVVQHITWQANDPLVHYLASDLNWAEASKFDPTVDNLTNENLGQLNQRYMPWGGHIPINPNTPDDPNTENAYNLAVKDPLVWRSDYWDFPTYKMPTIGWLGRVHRGTPWQTVDMKSSLPGLGNWATNWTGDMNAFDADNSSPSADWQLFDLFTTAFDDNATRGQLSVNVGAPNGPSLAAWSALFSGVVVVTNTIGGYTVIQPAGAAGANSFLDALVANINQTRTTFTNADGLGGTFEHVGDILAAPYLTVSNPWLLQNNNTNTINDEMYEWLPQQVMSLLRDGGTPQSPMRYVIYCYGQTLKPAPNGIVTSGSEFGLCTNYQVVAEADTRAVVQFNSTRADNIFPTNINVGGVLISTWTNIPSMISSNAVIKSFNVLPSD
jgi:hypothetical protein